MNLSQTATLLSTVASFNNRTVGESDVVAWQSVLPDIELADAEEAVRRHYADSTDWLMPAHIRRAVVTIIEERENAARATPWAAGQYGVLKADAMPEVAGPVDENAITPSVRALLDSVRAMLPEGSREALMPRRVAWEREHRAFDRQENGEPNPHYRPSAKTIFSHDNCIHAPYDAEAMRCERDQLDREYGSAPAPLALPDIRRAAVEDLPCPPCSATSQDLAAHMTDYHPNVDDWGGPEPLVLPDERRCRDCGLVAPDDRMEKHLVASGHEVGGDVFPVRD